MKRIYQYALLVMISGFAFTACAPARVVVRERPAPPVYVVERPAPPYPGAVWVGEEWAWRGGRYEYVRPHWERPRGTWHPGYWETRPHGYSWHAGVWIR